MRIKICAAIALTSGLVYSYATCYKSTPDQGICAFAGDNVGITLVSAPQCAGGGATCPPNGCSCNRDTVYTLITTTATGNARKLLNCRCMCDYVCNDVTYSDGLCTTPTSVYILDPNTPCPS